MSEEVTIQDMEEKIKRVEEDIKKLQIEGGENSGRKLEVLSDYKSYLQDELKMMKHEKRSGKSTS
jgi:hypothetical protein